MEGDGGARGGTAASEARAALPRFLPTDFVTVVELFPYRAIRACAFAPLSSPLPSSAISVATSHNRRSILGQPVARSTGRRVGGGARARVMHDAGNDGEGTSATVTTRGYLALNFIVTADLVCCVFH